MSFAVRGQWMQHAHRPATTVCVCVYSANRQDGGHRYWIVCVCVSLGEQAAFIP